VPLTRSFELRVGRAMEDREEEIIIACGVEGGS
jgi:hypothetical protein